MNYGKIYTKPLKSWSQEVKDLRAQIIFPPSADEFISRGLPTQEAEIMSRYLIVPVTLLKHADWNYRDSTSKKAQRKQKQLDANLSSNGQVENILVRELKDTGYMEVPNGNHRLTSFGKNGTAFAKVFCLGAVSINKAIKLTIETNESGFDTNYTKLSGLMTGLLEDPEFTLQDLKETTPFDSVEFESIISLGSFSWENMEKEIKKEVSAEQGKELKTFKGTKEKPKDKKRILDIEITNDDYKRFKKWKDFISLNFSSHFHSDSGALVLILKLVQDFPDKKWKRLYKAMNEVEERKKKKDKKPAKN